MCYVCTEPKKRSHYWRLVGEDPNSRDLATIYLVNSLGSARSKDLNSPPTTNEKICVDSRADVIFFRLAGAITLF